MTVANPKIVLEVGSQIPDFKIPSHINENFKLSDLSGKKIILFFYPKDNTPGCTIEGQDFNARLEQFQKLNAVVLGISRDSVNSHCKFADKFNFKFELLSDENEALCQFFDVIKVKNMYGKSVLGIERSTFIIDENQKLIKEYRKVKAEGHAEFILQEISAL